MWTSANSLFNKVQNILGESVGLDGFREDNDVRWRGGRDYPTPDLTISNVVSAMGRGLPWVSEAGSAAAIAVVENLNYCFGGGDSFTQILNATHKSSIHPVAMWGCCGRASPRPAVSCCSGGGKMFKPTQAAVNARPPGLQFPAVAAGVVSPAQVMNAAAGGGNTHTKA